MENNFRKTGRRQAQFIDGIRTDQASAAVMSRPTLTTPIKQRTYFKPSQPPKVEKRLWRKLQLPLLFAAGTVGGFFADNLVLGLGLVAIYAVTAFATNISSRITFTLALLLLASISILLLFKPNMQLIGNFASYAFALLVVGVITLGKESRLPKRTRRKYRR